MAIDKENEFPQFVTQQTEPMPAIMLQEALQDFKNGTPTDFVRPASVQQFTVNQNRIEIVCVTENYRNRQIQTHETQMHQFKLQQDCKTESMRILIDFWTDFIFRVRYGVDGVSDDIPVFPPEQSRMLIGSPSNQNLITNTLETDHEIRISTKHITLVINKAKFCMKAADINGRTFWEQYRTDLFTADIFDMSTVNKNGRAACFESIRMRNQEEIFGLGERFDHVARRGCVVDFWNKDAIGTSNRRTYINVPFLLSTRGYGLFLNSSAKTDWEIGTLEASSLGFAVNDSKMDYFVIYGPDPSEIVRNYCGLTGFSPLPPVWSFGLWMSRNSYMSWEIVKEVAKQLREKDIPADVLHLDTSWFEESWNCDLQFSRERFADPEENMKHLLGQGFRTSLWQYNFIPPKENNKNFIEAREKGYLVTDKEGKLFSYPEGTIGSWVDDAIIDFSNLEACEWYAEQIRELIRMGAAAIKTDFGEGIPAEGQYKNINGEQFHNLYSLVYNAVVAKAIHEVSDEWIVWARSGTAGSQRYPIHWGGDSQCSFEGLSGTLRAALSMGISGFPFFSHDIGGFIGRPSPELYIRWSQFGLFSSHARCHGCGNGNGREPWTFGEDAESIFRKYAKLRYQLMPYIYEQAEKCTRTALPMVRALLFEVSDDRNVWHIDDQYYFGDSLLIAPVLESMETSTVRTLYLPKGTWFDYWTKEAIVSSGEWIEKVVDLETMPMYVKSGSVLKYTKDRSSTQNKIGEIVKIETYDLALVETLTGVEQIAFRSK